MSQRAPEPIDWALAERVAVKLADRHPTPAPSVQPHGASLVPLVALADELVTTTTRLRPPSPAVVEVVDRATWIRANLATFRSLVNGIEDAKRADGEASGTKKPSKAAAVQLGLLLGWMSGRVLGQYDVLVGDANGDAGGDAVYLVGPNMALLEQKHGFDPTQFRLWVILHELTHRAQFLGVPWMRNHYRGLVQEMVAIADLDPAQIVASIRDAVRDRSMARERMDQGGLAAILATDDQRSTLRSIAGLMTLLEGHGDVVMTRAGGVHVPDAEHFATVLRQRRNGAPPLSRLLMRLLGVDAKLQQYQAGECFVTSVEQAAGERAIDHCWQSVDNLPTFDEVRSPDRWLARVGVARV